MSSFSPWLPPCVQKKDFENWGEFKNAVYSYFEQDFVNSSPTWPGKNLTLKRHPEREGKSATFWHFTTKGSVEDARAPDEDRCERIRWPRPMIDRYPDHPSNPSDDILWWPNKRQGGNRILLSLPDFRYLVVMADRGSYIMPWTAYPVNQPHRRRKLEKEYKSYWKL